MRYASLAVGLNVPFSMEIIVCLVVETMSASFCCEKPFSSLNFFMLFLNLSSILAPYATNIKNVSNCEENKGKTV